MPILVETRSHPSARVKDRLRTAIIAAGSQPVETRSGTAGDELRVLWVEYGARRRRPSRVLGYFSRRHERETSFLITATSFADRIIRWQTEYGRHDLPWQRTKDPYLIWLAEIMLQQTQVPTVIPYYVRFLERFPTLASLAAARMDEVLERWAGLGYYARARNLHRCAQILVIEGAGTFSPDPRENARLPGIGRSTAAAISVFAFGTRAAILDGNVRRVLARCFAVEDVASARGLLALWALAESLLPQDGIESYTQGLMDLGALRCTRHKPACHRCPVEDICVARRDDRQGMLPKARAAKIRPERVSRTLILTDGRQVLLERRPPAGLWGGLLTLPEPGGSSAEVFALAHGCRLVSTQELAPATQAFSHFHLTMHVLRCEVEVVRQHAAEARWQWWPIDQLGSAAVPALITKVLRAMPAPRPA